MGLVLKFQEELGLFCDFENLGKAPNLSDTWTTTVFSSFPFLFCFCFSFFLFLPSPSLPFVSLRLEYVCYVLRYQLGYNLQHHCLLHPKNILYTQHDS